MKFITENIKRKYKNKLNETVDIEDKFNQCFYLTREKIDGQQNMFMELNIV